MEFAFAAGPSDDLRRMAEEASKEYLDFLEEYLDELKKVIRQTPSMPYIEAKRLAKETGKDPSDVMLEYKERILAEKNPAIVRKRDLLKAQKDRLRAEYVKARENREVVPYDQRVSMYRRLAGEADARAIQARANLSAPERAARAPWLDYDVPENEQIVRFRNRDIANALMQSGGRP